MRKLAVVFLIAASLVVVTGQRPALAASPAYTNSQYLQTLNTSDNYDDGCSYGNGDVSGVHILAVGRVAYDSSTDSFGTISPSLGFWSNSAIFAAAEAWAQGWFACSTSSPTIYIAVGVNDSYDMGTCGSCGDKLPAMHGLPGGGTGTGSEAAGAYFGGWVAEFESNIESNPYDTQETAAGAFDAEPAWDPSPGWGKHTAAFDSEYNTHTSNPMFDFGSAEQGDVSLQDVYEVAYGEPDNYNFPEFYYGTNTGAEENWISGSSSEEGVDQWAYNSHLSFYITGVNDDYNTPGCTLSPSQDYTDVLNTIQGASNVNYQPAIEWITNFGVLC
ncbi:MAG: hypothetical protein ACRD0Z_15410 [Acidimicrobiales bacterium]